MDILGALDFKKMLLDRDLYDVTVAVQEQQKAEVYSVEKLDTLLEPTIQIAGSPARIGDNLLADLEIFRGYSEGQETIFTRLDNRVCKGSRLYLEKLMATPIESVETLTSRKRILLDLEKRVTDEQKQDLQQLKTTENSVLFFYDSSDQDLDSFYDIVYFKVWFLSFLNNSDKALTMSNAYRICISPLIGILSPIMYVIVPYFVLRLKLKVKMSFVAYVKMVYQGFMAGLGSDSIFSFSPTMSKLRYLSYGLSVLFYFQNVFSNVEMARLVYKVSRFLTNKVNDLLLFTQASKRLIESVWSEEINQVFWKDTTLQACCSASDLYCSIPVNDKHFLLDNFGKQLALFKQFNKATFQNTIKRVYMLDSLISIIKAKQQLSLSYPTFSGSSQSELSLKGLFHPSIEQAQVVRNDVLLKDDARSLMITGPNAGGKSTFIKAVLLSVLLAQTIVLVPAQACKISAFHLINSQINIPDCKGKESLFEAEMNRSRKSIEMLKEMDGEGKPSIIVMDEIFNSTNPVEGISGAYAIAKKLASFSKNITLITTHYIYLTKLQKEGGYRNYKMNITKRPDGSILYPYKLSKGVSQQYIALELLQASGFDQEIVDQAIAIRDHLTKNK